MAAKPVVLTRAASNPAPNRAPEPLLIIGTIPASAVANATTATRGVVLQSVAIADQAASTLPTDFASTKVQLDAIINKLNALLAAQRTAGQIAP